MRLITSCVLGRVGGGKVAVFLSIHHKNWVKPWNTSITIVGFIAGYLHLYCQWINPWLL